MAGTGAISTKPPASDRTAASCSSAASAAEQPNILYTGIIGYDTIAFGNGTDDSVDSSAGNTSIDEITFGNGAGDYVAGNNGKDTIIFGDGADDSARTALSYDTITFGSGYDTFVFDQATPGRLAQSRSIISIRTGA